MTHIEKMKQWLEALEEAVHYTSAPVWSPSMTKECNEAITSLRQAIAEAEKENALQALHAENEKLGLYKDAYAEQEPVAWIHIMDNTEGIKANGKGIVSITQKRKHPFGKPGLDFSKSYPVTSTPLYTHPPQRTEQEPVAYLNPDDLCADTAFRWCKIDAFTKPVYLHSPQRTKVVFPTMLRKMWSGGEVQAWLDENVNKENT